MQQEAKREPWLCRYLDFRFLGSVSVRINFCRFKPSFCGTLLMTALVNKYIYNLNQNIPICGKNLLTELLFFTE